MDIADKVVEILWQLSGDSDGLVMESSERSRIANELRALAAMIESSPEKVTGIVISSGIKAVNENGQECVKASFIVSGSAPAVAATFISLEELGKMTLHESFPHVLAAEAVAWLHEAPRSMN